MRIQDYVIYQRKRTQAEVNKVHEVLIKHNQQIYEYTSWFKDLNDDDFYLVNSGGEWMTSSSSFGREVLTIDQFINKFGITLPNLY